MAKKTAKKDTGVCKECGREFDRNAVKSQLGEYFDTRFCSAFCYTKSLTPKKGEKYLAVVVISDGDLIATWAFFSDEKSFEKEMEFRGRAIEKINDNHRKLFSDEEVKVLEVGGDTIGIVTEDMEGMVLWYRQGWLNEGFKTMPVDAEEIEGLG